MSVIQLVIDEQVDTHFDIPTTNQHSFTLLKQKKRGFWLSCGCGSKQHPCPFFLFLLMPLSCLCLPSPDLNTFVVTQLSHFTFSSEISFIPSGQ